MVIRFLPKEETPVRFRYPAHEAGVAQRQSSAFVKQRSRVRFSPPAQIVFRLSVCPAKIAKLFLCGVRFRRMVQFNNISSIPKGKVFFIDKFCNLLYYVI